MILLEDKAINSNFNNITYVEEKEVKKITNQTVSIFNRY